MIEAEGTDFNVIEEVSHQGNIHVRFVIFVRSSFQHFVVVLSQLEIDWDGFLMGWVASSYGIPFLIELLLC